MLISIHDKTLQRVAFIDNEKPEGLHFFSDVWHRYLIEATSTFDFSVPKTGNTGLQHLTEKNYVSFRYDGQDYLFSIMRTEETETELTCYAENLNLELLNEMAAPYKANGPQKFVDYFNNETQIGGQFYSDLVIGINEVSDSSRTLEWEGTDTKLARLLSLVNKFDAECEFVTKLDRDGTLSKIVLNIYKEHSDKDQGVGVRRNDVTLYYGKGIDGIRRTTDKTELYSAIYPLGKDGLNIGALDKTEYDEKGKVLYYTPAGSPYIFSPVTAETYPAQISSNDDPWILNRFDYDTDNVNTLYGQALAKLKKISTPAITYEVEGPFELKIGDTVTIHDDKFTPTLLLEARVSEQEVSFCDPTKNKNIFSNFKALENRLSSDITSRLNQLVQDAIPYKAEILTNNGTVFRNGTGSTTLTARVLKGTVDMTKQVILQWTRDGTVISSSPTVMITAAEVVGKTLFRLSVKNGSGSELCFAEVTVMHVLDGTGIKTIDVEYCQSTSSTTPPSGPWFTTAPTWENGKYIWTRTLTKYTNGSNITTTPVCVTGEQGGAGVSATAIQEQYYLSTASTTQSGGTWTETCPEWVKGKYIWTRSKCSWSNGTATYTAPVLAQGLNTANSAANTAKDTAKDAQDTADVAQEIANAATLKVTDLKADVAKIDTAMIGKADIDLANIKNGCITTAMIGTGVIGTTQIADGSITDAKIVGLTANKITAGRLDAALIEVVNLNAANITVGTINGVQIAPGAITGDKLGQQVNDLINGAVSGAQQAQTTADGKNKIYYQNTQPGLVGNKKGDTWFDTANGYRTYIWNGTAWSLSPFGSGAIADDAVTLAKVGADLQSFMDGINAKATTAQTSADGKNTVFYQGTTPSTVGRKVGDTWFNSADGNRVYTWNGSTWAAAPFGTNALGNLSVTNALIANGAIDNAKIASLDAGKITAGVLAAARIGAGSITADKLASKSITVGQINDAAIQAINDLVSVGGRNYYKKTTPISVSGVSTTVDRNNSECPNGFYTVGVKELGGNWRLGGVIQSNGDWTISLEVRGSQNVSVSFSLDVCDVGLIRITTTADNTWKKVEHTVNVTNHDANPAVYNFVDMSNFSWAYFYIRNIKIEKGNKATDWTPAPEDTDASIAQNSIANWCYNNNLTYINGGKIYTGTVNADKIAANAIVAGKIAANAVTVVTIAAGAVNVDKLAANSVNASKIVAGSITAAQLAASTITGNKIAAGTISAGLLAANSVTADKIVTDAITTAKIAAKAVTANEIAVGTITAAQIAANAITATQLAAGAVTAAKIAAGQITADKIAAGAITADKFYGTSITSKNYVANSAGTKIDLSNGIIDTKNFKVDSAGNVAMTGALTMQGAQTITIKNNSAVKVGNLSFVQTSGDTWSPGTVSLAADGRLQLAAGTASSTKAFATGWAGGTQLFEMGREGSAYSVWIGTGPATRIGVSNAQSPQVYATGCTKTIDFIVASGFSKPAGTLNNIVYNSMGRFCQLSFSMTGNVNGGTHTLILTVPAGYRPLSDIYVAGVGGIYGWFQIFLASNGELKVWHPSGMTSFRGTVFYYL